MSSITRAHVVVYAALAATVAILIIGFYGHAHGATISAPGESMAPAAGQSVVATEHAAAEVCFSRKSWSANDVDRPCDVLFRPQEDGSTALELGTEGRTIAQCVIPNPTEEGRHFSVHCTKVR